MSTARIALELLLEEDVLRAGQLAQELEILNTKRQIITRELKEQAEKLALEDVETPPILFAFHPDFRQGVVGLAASNLAEKYYRPAIIGERRETFTTASCRSIPEFSIIDALDQCEDLLEHHGGHTAAAGFTISNDNIPAFVIRMTQIAEKVLNGQKLTPTLHADAEVKLSDLDPELLTHLSWLEPTGYGNPQAEFASRGVKVKSSRRIGNNGDHLKLKVTDGKITFDAIAFQQGNWDDKMPAEIDLLFTFEENEFQGSKTLQLNVKDIKES